MSRRKALVCDDDGAMARIVQHLLRKEGFAASIAATGPEAVERVRAEKPDLLVLELQLSGLDGEAVLQSLGADKPKVLVLTNSERPERLARAKELGADAVLVKPFAVPELSGAARRLIEGGAA